MEIRRATAGDAATVAELERKYIECPWSENVVRQTIEDDLSVLYLLCEGETVVGYGGLKMALDTAEVYNIAVEEAYRRCGCGTRLLRKLIEHAAARGAREMFLEVHENNVAAVALYTAHGFTAVRLRKNYYKSGNAVIMRRRL